MKFPTLIEWVLNNVDPLKYYSKLHGWSGANISCPFHDDRKPSFAVNIQTGQGFCHAPSCNKKIAHIVHCHAEWRDMSELAAAREIYEQLVYPLLAKSEVNKFVKELKEFPLKIKQIEKQLGLTPETQLSFRLGLDPANGRILIPITTQFGPVGFWRAYKLPLDREEGSDVPKIINKPKGSGRTDLFPWDHIREYDTAKPLLFQKAERDTMLGIQMGFQCFCLTGSGESSSIEPWASELKDFEVYVIPDGDTVGLKAAEKRLLTLQDAQVVARMCELPEVEIGKDFSDWVLFNKGDADKLTKLLNKAGENKPKTSSTKKQVALKDYVPVVQPEEIKHVPLNDLDSINNQTVSCRAIVIGAMDRRYRIPTRFAYTNGSDDKQFFDVPQGRELVHLIRKSDEEIIKYLRQEIVGKKHGEISVVERTTATEIELAPVVDPTEPYKYTVKPAIILGDDFDTNTPYELKVKPVTTIDKQEAVALVTERYQISDALDMPDSHELQDLNIFRPKDDKPETAWKKLMGICEEVTMHTRIYNRPDWHLCCLLTWLSPLYFSFASDGSQRGWINTLGIGDTKTGKSDVAKGLQGMFGCGAFMSGENCTYVGLVGGAIKTSTGNFILRWGRIPINDRQLVVIEELSGLTCQQISMMSEVRSAGMARIDKGGITAEANSRTRLLCIANVRGTGRQIESYPHGVDAILELIGQPEDVSRFDLICTLADSEVDAEVINAPNHSIPRNPKYTADRFNKLVRLVWCLKEDQILFTDEAIAACREGAMAIGKDYSPSIPIFKASFGRILLARISTAIACLLYSFIIEGEEIYLEVNEVHVECAEKLLRMLYNKPSFGYDGFSKAISYMHLSDEQKGDLWKKCKDILNNNKEHIGLFKHLLQSQDIIDARMFTAVSGFSNLLIMLTREGVCSTNKGSFQITHKGRTWAKSIK